MKVTSIDIIPSKSNNVINLSFRDPMSKNPYVVKAIVGLDAEAIMPKFYEGAALSNSKYYDLSLEKRDIVIQISLNPNFSIGKSYSELRDDLYKIISSSRTGAIQLQFKNNGLAIAAISGFVTKFEVPHFTKTPIVQLTVTCSEPMLKALQEENLNINSLDPKNTIIVDNKSTAPHGVRFGVRFSGKVSNFSVKDAIDPTWLFEVDLTGSAYPTFISGDEFHFSSENNNLYLLLIRNFDVIHLVDRVVPGSVWPIIFPGTNTFICSEPVNWDYITYYPTYWGI